MERFAADSIRGERDHAIKMAIKNNVPWTTLAEDFGMTVKEMIETTDRLGLSSPTGNRDDLRDAREEGRHVHGRK